MHNDNSEAAIPLARALIALEPVSVRVEAVPMATGLSRTRIFRAIANNELQARKDGKATIVEVSELRRFIHSLPTRGKSPEAISTATRCAGQQKGLPSANSNGPRRI
jgi:hypothetical protein